MMKRCIALLMTLCMLWTGMAAAFAIDIDVKAEYAEAQQALKDYLDGYSKYAIDEIVVWFGTCGNYMMSFRFSQYAQCLQAVEREEFGMIPFWLASMRQDKAFIAYLEENEFRSLDDLECYIMGCQAEAEGRIDDAIRYYNLCSICDSSRRSAKLWSGQYETKYQLALEHYRANTCQDAETARDLFRELAQMPYRDSAQMAEKAEALRLSLVDISASVKGDGLRRTVTVKANADWTAVSNVPWISLSKTKGTGNATVSIRLEENPSAEHSRTGYLTFTSKGQSVRVTVSQARRDSVTARLSGTGDERTIRVTANGVWKAESNASWIGLSKTSGRDDATITVTLDKYSSTTRDRTGTVTFTCGSAACTLEIEQKKAASISGTVTVSGNTATIKVAANGSWKASTTADWIVLKKASGSGSATITAELKDNPSATSERQGTVVLTCGDKSVSVTVRKPKGKIAVSGVSLNQTTAKLTVGGKVPLAVTVSPANATDKSVTWSTSNASVATVTNGVVTGKNAGTATITVKSADGAKTAKCTVTVYGKPSITFTSYPSTVKDRQTGFKVSAKITGGCAPYTVEWRGYEDGEHIRTYPSNTISTNTAECTFSGLNTCETYRAKLTITDALGQSVSAYTDDITVKEPEYIKITSVTKESNGQATVRWTDERSSSGAYRVNYLQKRSDSFENDRDMGVYWYDGQVDGTKNRFATTSCLVPGYSYWIVVRDVNDSSIKSEPYAYNPGSAASFSEYANTLTFQLRINKDGKKTDVSSFQARDINTDNGSTTFGAYVENRHSVLARARSYYGIIGIKDPRGQVIATTHETLDYPVGDPYKHWDSYSLNWYFEKVKKTYGSVPTGTYTVTLYLNGQTAATTTFKVN